MTADTAATIRKRNARRDMQILIGMVLDSPISAGTVTQVDGRRSIEEYAELNTDVKTRIVMKQAIMAMNGNIKAADFLFHYGGMEPVKEANVTADAPIIIEDIPMITVGSGTTIADEDEDDEKDR